MILYCSISGNNGIIVLSIINYHLQTIGIGTREFVGSAWSKQGKEVRAPNISGMIHWFNLVSKSALMIIP